MEDMFVHIFVVSTFLHSCSSVDLTYYVEEGKLPGTYLGDIATDAQEIHILLLKDHSQITFEELPQRQTSSTALFNVTRSGKLYTTQLIDAEHLCMYNTECFKTIKIAVRQAETFIKVLKVRVFIKDVNDNEPTFPKKLVKIDFSETDRKGTMKSIPNAIDKDVGLLNSKITYRLRKSAGEPFTLFVAEKEFGTSKLGIVLEKSLDREVKDVYKLQVIAKDEGSPIKIGILEVQISVTDINDNRPVFSHSMNNISIKNTHPQNIPILVLSATDLDSGNNGNVSYQFNSKTPEIAKEKFKLTKNGEIYAQEIRNLGKKQSYKLFVDATDGGNPPLSSIAMVLINVINQQNTPPELDINFVSQLQENLAAISEKIEVGSFIAYVSVIDNDVGKNGEVSCSLNHDKFQLLNLGSKEYKIIMKKPVNREVTDHYDMSITCEDAGSPPLQTKREFSIQVMDVNDVRPQFIKSTFKFLTYENEKSNFPVGFINATDPDLGDGSKLAYSLENGKNQILPFKITNYGFISTIKSLDREQHKTYSFKVIVKDNGSPSLSNTANVIVEVMDENDNAPYFTFPSVNPFSLDVHYHPQSKNDITVLRALDRDSRENAFLKYNIISGNEKQLFTVNTYSGMLSFSRKVYQNDAGSYNLLLVVKDSGSPVLSATTTLSLTLTVSNRTSPMLTAAHIQSSDMIDINLVIVIVVTAVVISIAIVVIITICIVRCNRRRNMLHTAAMNPAMQPGREKCLMISQSNNPFAITQNPEEGVHHSTPSMRSRRDFCPEQELPVEWTSLTSPGKMPASVQACIQEVGATSGRSEKKFISTQDYYPKTVSTPKNTGHSFHKKDTSPYEEIPGM
ncbi:putative protocadherin beta-18 [Octopus bimaculoides]|uniref:putative protocadherin beta-18 n=1 Tax=Octopus bimaculoides TaxID=37653 RepID=UPI00071C7532|nr:putative protocadherin beta-18 [Octopus bimaculoides]XP_052829084.1 putative protocadherin beta-18 [Octopus bimaculoides]XP_052829086.1 putative protocadherin beta-18 [Octopus bimaculoides]|eukprot:XP_014782863.1 PREDICTED: putative protocadherin beta-18 [Octopus bimaculoides]